MSKLKSVKGFTSTLEPEPCAQKPSEPSGKDTSGAMFHLKKPVVLELPDPWETGYL